MFIGHFLVALCLSATPADVDQDYLHGMAAGMAAANLTLKTPVVKEAELSPVAVAPKTEPKVEPKVEPSFPPITYNPYSPYSPYANFNSPEWANHGIGSFNINSFSIKVDTPKVEPPKAEPPKEPVKPKAEPPKMKLEDVKTYAQACQYADERNSTLLLIASAKWCSPCHAMRKDTFDSKEVNEFFVNNNVSIVFYLDVDKDGSKNILKSLGMIEESIPAYCYIAKGKASKFGHGNKSIQEFIDWSKGKKTTTQWKPVGKDCCPGGVCP